MSDKKPTHDLSVKDNETGDYAKIGVAWLNEDGHISIKLHPCVVISYEGLKGKLLTLFPCKTDKEWAAHQARRNAAKRTAEHSGE